MTPLGALRDSRGLSLVELFVVSAIMLTLSAMLYGTISFQSQTFNRTTAEEVTQNGLRIWVARMVNDIRRACFNPTEQTATSFGIVNHGNNDFRFYADWNSSGTLGDARSNLGYRLSNGTLQRWSGGSTWRTVLTGVQGSSLFTYRDVDRQELDASALTAESIAEVEVSLSAQASTAGVPGATPAILSEKATATLRNDDCH